MFLLSTFTQSNLSAHKLIILLFAILINGINIFKIKVLFLVLQNFIYKWAKTCFIVFRNNNKDYLVYKIIC